MNSPPPLWLLTGCTAVGKTAAALDWAEERGAEIVSCDSLLFYRGMDLGTAKPTPAERARAPHHMIDVLEPAERMDVKTYVALAQRAVREIESRGRRVLVTGGSGFYLKSFFGPVADDVELDPELRREIEQQLATEGLEALVRQLEALNPGGLGALDVRNPRRVVRALERCRATGESLTALAARFRTQPAPFAGRELLLVELAREPEDLRQRIARRAAAMVREGLIDEVKTLRERGLEQNPSAANAIGYRETLRWLDAPGASPAALIEEIAQRTWVLVRKQRTWFRTQLPPHQVRVIPPGAEAQADTLFDD